MAIPHIDTFVTFDPILISRLIIGFNFNQVKGIFGHKLVDDWATNCKHEIAEKFDPAPINGKNYCLRFFRVYFGIKINFY